MREAKTYLSKLLDQVAKGIEVLIVLCKMPIARLVHFKAKTTARNFRPKVGEITSKSVSYSDDAFNPLSAKELKEWGL